MVLFLLDEEKRYILEAEWRSLEQKWTVLEGKWISLALESPVLKDGCINEKDKWLSFEYELRITDL